MTIHVIDFFSGCGGSSAGFRASGLRVRAGLDIDPDAAATFQANFPEAAAIVRDIRDLRTAQIKRFVVRKNQDLLCFSACAPCQPFTKQRHDLQKHDSRATLLWEFLRFVRYYWPDFIFIENVPGIRKARFHNSTFEEFSKIIGKLGYDVRFKEVNSCDYGVPQRRRRLILIASRHRGIRFPLPTHGPDADKPYPSAWETIRHFPRIRAGTKHHGVLNHQAAALSPLNLRRIKATPADGGRADWPAHLRLSCHEYYGGHTDVYGRIRKSGPATGLTTRCISLSNGRFGHPTQNRAISVREAAALQTFDDDFAFCGSLNSMARQVGNAVPVALAKVFGLEFKRLAALIQKPGDDGRRLPYGNQR